MADDEDRETAYKVPDEAAPIAVVPLPNDMDADYSPQYVKLARMLRAGIWSGNIRPSSSVRAADLVEEYGVSAMVALAALNMLAANSYVTRPGNFRPYKVTWDIARMPAKRNESAEVTGS
jgi:DNA-binding FadR family transcriptional regulator